MLEKPKWKRFEDLAAKIQRELSPLSATVTQDEHFHGTLSGTDRQIDILVRIPTEAGEMRLVIDCKDHSSRIDVKDVEMFIGLVQDVGASKGMLVSALGYTKAARRRAEAAGVEVLTLIDVESADWPSRATIPVLIEKMFPEVIFRLETNSDKLRLVIEELPGLPLLDETGRAVGTPLTLFGRLWNNGAIDCDQRFHQDIPLHADPLFTPCGDGVASVHLRAAVRILSTFYFGQVSLAQLRGFATDATTVQTRGLTTDWIRYIDVETHWQRLDDEESLAVRPLLVIQNAAVLAE